MKKLGVLVVHGMGSPAVDFADGLIEEVEDRLRSVGLDPDTVAWRPALWGGVLGPSEDRLRERMEAGGPLRWDELRRFVVHSLADALAYRRVERCGEDEISVYDEIHAQIAREIRALRERIRAERAPDAPEAPLVVVAHSLGGHILSNFIWDAQCGHTASRGNDFEDLRTLSGIVTFGCNIPLFTLAYKKVLPISFPLDVTSYFPAGTSPRAILAATRWLNLYDPDDVLGWPLRTLSPEYARAVAADRPVNVGGLLSSWNPLSHTEYWEDNDLTETVAETVSTLLRLL